MCQCKSQSSGCSPCECSCHSLKSCCQQSQCGCQSQGCCGSGCKSCSGKYGNKFFELADQAWMEVLKEKIKANIQSSAKNMDELARLISEANHERWQKKIEDKECCGCFEEKLKAFFQKSCKSNQK